MTSEEPTYLPQGISYLGFLAQQLGDLRGKTTLAHELIQNADDAKDNYGNLSATIIAFDVTDDALIVSNDAVFREADFDRMRELASGSKRREAGDRTTGAFGVGFVSVYQITDRPEIHSAGRRWIFRPDNDDGQQIKQTKDPSITDDRGTRFRLPWAFQESRVRQELRSPIVGEEYVDSFSGELSEALPKAILFLKRLESMDLLRNGEQVTQVTRVVEGDTVLVDCNGETKIWRFFEGEFSKEASNLRAKFSSLIDADRSSRVRIAVPDSLVDTGLLFATLPTDQATGLPFHIDADFFPASDRKSIVFEDSNDPRSEWNRAAITAAASVVKANLISLKETFENDPTTFWGILARLNSVFRERRDDRRMPLGVFWETLEPSLGDAPIVYSESGKWLKPDQTRMPVSDEEKQGVPAFNAIGLETVHQQLWSYQNILTSNSVGVERINAKHVYDALKGKGMIGRPQSLPSDLRSLEVLALLWQGVLGVLNRTPASAKAQAESLLARCTLAPGIDGKVWPCRAAFRADVRTRKVFEFLLPDDVSFLTEEHVPLLDRLCPRFTPDAAIRVLESLSHEDLRARWKRGDFAPSDLLEWFDDNKSELTEELSQRLARLALFPSVSNLHPLSDLWLPGGFNDPMGVTDVLDTGPLGGLTDFLRSLGIRELTFEDYATRYIAEAFASGNRTSISTKLKHLANIEVRIGEIRGNRELRDQLSAVNIVECVDGDFRRPSEVYFPSDAVKLILGDFAKYANLPLESENRQDLYHWLGVGNRPRVRDILRIVELQASKPPTPTSRSIVVNMLEALGTLWGELDDSEKAMVATLKGKEWLPAEGDFRKWYKPEALYAGYNKNLFESQTKFIDVPIPIQQRISDLLANLQVKTRPEPSLVVKHLVRCSEINREPPRGIYRWLNDNAQTADVRPLTEAACIWVGDRYLKPAQVFWANHPFGRFRVQLGADLRSYQNLLRFLGIRESPDYEDAIEVLRDVSRESGTGQLAPEELDVVFQCWIMLSEALRKRELDTAELESYLRDTQCVPNRDGQLRKPSWMFFEGRPGLAEKFPEQLKGNCIPRTERVWTAMEAAGVRTLSTVVQGHINKALNPQEDEEIEKRVTERREIIGAILEGVPRQRQSDGNSISLDDIRFFSTDELSVVWELRAFERKWAPTSPEPVQAHLDVDTRAMYFTLQPNGGFSWASIARELSFAVAPDEAIGSVSPGLTFILEAETPRDARVRAQELGIVPVEELGELSGQGDVAETFDDHPTTENIPEHSSISGGHSTSPDQPRDPAPPQDSNQQTEQDIPFAKRLHEVQTVVASRAAQRQVWMPVKGPKTEESARKDTEESIRTGRLGSISARTVSRWEPVEAANDLADRFKTMVHSDYGQRCQICSKSFTMPGNRFQVYVVHIVRPSVDHRTNHLGDLLGLCGWHYSLIRYGEWAFLDPDTDQPFEDSDESQGWEQMWTFMSKAPQQIDEVGNSYIGLPIRFWNVYHEWDPDPVTVNEEVRYSIPHWEYLCELLNV